MFNRVRGRECFIGLSVLLVVTLLVQLDYEVGTTRWMVSALQTVGHKCVKVPLGNSIVQVHHEYKTGCPLSSYRITATSSKVRNTSAFLQQFRYTVVHQVLRYIGTLVLSSVVHQVLSFVVHKVLRYRDVTGTVLRY